MADGQQGGQTPIIFIIEQEEEERTRLSDVLTDAGCTVIPMPSVDNAILLLENGAVCNLVILAVDTVGASPDKFDRLLQAGATRPAVIVYGVDSETRVVVRCLSKGASDFLNKPIDRDELLNAVDNAMQYRGDWSNAEAAISAASHVTGWIELTSSSGLEMFRRLQRFSDALFDSRLPRDVCDDLKQAVEEVGRNAVEWGNNFNPDKRVHVSYCIFTDRVVIKVEDEGEGFTPEKLPDPTADPVKTMKERQSMGKRPGGYGVFLLHKLVDDIVYNEKGNAVLLIKYLPGTEENRE